MSRRMQPLRLTAPIAGALLALLAGAMAGHTQTTSQEWLDRCADRSQGDGDRVTHCELREATLGRTERLAVSARPNGSIDISGSDRSDIQVTARVQTWAETEAMARELARQVQLEAGGGRIEATGPTLRGQRNRGWSVSYVVSTPRTIDLELGTVNGGLTVRDVDGDLSLTTTNGGIRLDAVAGSVEGRTTNGGVDVRLNGQRWAGDGLVLQTTNGAIILHVPQEFAANLTARTVNGRIHTDLPLTVQGRIGRSIDAQIGGGGPTVRLSTTNGGIDIRQN